MLDVGDGTPIRHEQIANGPRVCGALECASKIAEASFVDDLNADSLALIELVEALEEELGERSVGFRIEDEDLEDLKSVRDAVDYVYERVK